MILVYGKKHIWSFDNIKVKVQGHVFNRGSIKV